MNKFLFLAFLGTLSASAHAVSNHSQPASTQETMARNAIITNYKVSAPELAVKPYEMPAKENALESIMARSEKYMYLLWGNVYQSQLNGMVGRILIDGNTFYLKDPFIGKPTNSYIKGELADGKVTFQFPQEVGIAVFEDESQMTLYANILEKVDLEDGAITYKAIEGENEMEFEWDGERLQATNPETMIGLLLENGNWTGYADWDMTWTLQTDLPTHYDGTAAAQPYGASYWDWQFIYNKEFAAPISVTFDADKFYISGLWGTTPDMVVEGRIEGDKAYIDKQYLGIDETNNAHIYFFPLDQKIIPIDELYFDLDETPKETYELNYDAQTGVFTSIDDNTFSINLGKDVLATVHTLGMGNMATISPFDKDAPAVPGFGNIYSYSNANASWGMFTFNFSFWDENKRYIDPEQTFYSVYFDDELYTFDTSVYTGFDEGVENVTEIPLLFNNNANIFSFNNDYSHQVTTFHAWERAGVQMIYKAGGQVLKSAIHYNDGSIVDDITGIDRLEADIDFPKVISEKIYDLAGHELTSSYRGICIRKVEYSDGVIKSYKVVNR